MNRDAIYALINEMNANRARRWIRQRYQPTEKDGELTMEFVLLDRSLKANHPSPIYGGPVANG